MTDLPRLIAGIHNLPIVTITTTMTGPDRGAKNVAVHVHVLEIAVKKNDEDVLVLHLRKKRRAIPLCGPKRV